MNDCLLDIVIVFQKLSGAQSAVRVTKLSREHYFGGERLFVNIYF
jgi:hypothetical protein